MPQPIIQFRNVTYTYQAPDEPALRSLSFSVQPGEWIHVIGPGGSGKTTICALLCGMLQGWPQGAVDGEIRINGHDHTRTTALSTAGNIGIVFQNPESSLIQEFVVDELAFGPENLNVPPDEIDKRIDQALEAVGIAEARERRLHELSGGQQQRIAIASVLTMGPKVLVFDNALGNLDAESADKLNRTLKALHNQGHTIITTASRFDVECGAERGILLEHGHVIAEGAIPELFTRHKAALVRLGALPDDEKIHVHPSQTDACQSPVLKVNRLSYSYRLDRPPVLRNLNMECYKGDFWAILGPNGAGKTTFGKLVAGLLRPPKGTLFLEDRDLSLVSMNELSQMVGYLFQRPEHQFVADTVLEECIFGLKQRSNTSKPYEPFGELCLERFGLLDRKHDNPHQLTIAEKRLLNLASATMMQPAVLLLDEPTVGLDYRAADLLMKHCADYVKRGNIVIMMTHDLHMARKWATKQLMFH